MRRHRLILLLFLLCAPLGWLLFWAVFRSVPGQDWVVFHTAAALFGAGDLRTLGDPVAFTDALNRTHAAWFARPISVLHPWVYPPVTLLIALAFGWLPYLWSLAVFLAVTLALMVASLWPWAGDAAGRRWLIFLILLCPAVAFQIGAGQLSFLVAACVLGGMALLETRPLLAGMVFSVLCVKPQFLPLLPVAMLAGRHWRAAAGGALGGVLLGALSLAASGVGLWQTWIRFALGGDPLLGRMIDVVRAYDQSAHTCLRQLGFSESVAGAGQIAAMAIAAMGVAIAFWRRWPLRTRTVILLLALIAGAPHVGDYDEILVAAAVALMLLDAPARPRREMALGAGAWLATMFNPPALFAVLKMPLITAASALTGFLPLMLVMVEVARCLQKSEKKKEELLF